MLRNFKSNGARAVLYDLTFLLALVLPSSCHRALNYHFLIVSIYVCLFREIRLSYNWMHCLLTFELICVIRNWYLLQLCCFTCNLSNTLFRYCLRCYSILWWKFGLYLLEIMWIQLSFPNKTVKMLVVQSNLRPIKY